MLGQLQAAFPDVPVTVVRGSSAAPAEPEAPDLFPDLSEAQAQALDDALNRAEDLSARRRFADAERVLRETLRTSGALPPDLQAGLREKLGGALAQQGELARAEPELRRALALREQALGPEDPRTLFSLNDLAQLLQRAGQ